MDDNQAPSIKRRDGITSAERYLKRLCERSFLSLWSYAGIYRDQLDSPTAKVGKEVCDLLVVFQDHIIIFSDKDCVYPTGSDEKLNWRRWFKRAVQGSAKQIWGAEKWIKNYPHRLFVDPACTQQFPLEIPNPSAAKIHRIVVAHGVSEQCRAVFGGSGCLLITPGVIGAEHMADNCKPFTIGQIDPTKGYIHIFDEASLSIVMHTLDTITDFVTYLIKKEQVIESGQLIYAGGENDLLAFYLMQGINKNNQGFASLLNMGGDAIIIADGFWHELQKSDKYKSFTDANKVSYVWDDLIESFNKHILAGNRHYISNLTVIQAEQIMRFLAREPRVRRRVLAQILLEMIEATPPSVRAASILQPSSAGDPYYTVLIFPPSDNSAEREHHQAQSEMLLKVYCAVTKLIKPDAQDIIGISIEKENDGSAHCFIEAMYLDAHIWTEQQQAEAQQAQKDFDLLANAPKSIRFEQGKYSMTLRTLMGGSMKGRDRNIPCPCGSRKKYKKCCGR
ncbi:MAG: SEC-C domain-containing protein [Ktedonobacteraceae bacterium]|nr:SEC-C domain-containing protein [Ktedonobacteraceae bacterium]